MLLFRRPGGRNRRPLRSLQVEVTSRCRLACGVCPRTALPAWVDADLSDAAWARLEADLHLAEDVHLQGWGEPLLDPQLPRRVGAARRAGCTVGFTTNGTGLAAAAGWIATAGIDRVSVSVASGGTGGAGARESPPAAWEGLEALARSRPGRRPRLLVAVLLGRDVSSLVPHVREACRVGADEVYVTHLDVTPSPDLLDQAAFSDGALRPGIGEALDEARRAASAGGIRFRGPARKAEDLLVCPLDPCRFAFVSADGRIGPCVNLLVPVRGPVPRCSNRGLACVDQVCWGTLPGDSLAGVLEGEARRRFIAPFEARLDAERQFLAASGGGWGGEALARLDRADRARRAALAAAPFPDACRGCHKAEGW